MFRRMNYLKHLACRIRDRINLEAPAPGDLDEIERLQAEAVGLRNRIVETHLRLALMVANKHVGAGYDLEERVCDGNFALLRAVERFDFARGYRFSTYATWAIFNQLVQRDRRERRRARSLASYQHGVAAPHPVSDRDEPDESPDERAAAVEQLLRGLDRRERWIVANRHGIGGVPERTLKQIGTDLGISKERVRQIEKRAHAKLRGLALLGEITPSNR
jgi:RNA polymerase primary sigma factor